MSTFLQIRQRCAARFSDGSNDIVLDATWKDYVNGRYRNVQAAHPYWPFMESRSTSISIAAGVRSANLTTDGWRVSAVWSSTDGMPLTPLEGRAAYRTLFPLGDSEAPGIPAFYRLKANALEVYPLPQVSTTFQVDLWLPAANLTADGDLPIFPSQYHDILVSGALSDAYLDDGNYKAHDVHEGRYKELLGAMMFDLLGPRNERNYEIVDDWY